MAWTEADRAKLRHYLGFAAIFLQADPRLENAITSVQSVADGGTRADNSTETQIRGWIADLESVEVKLKALWDKAMLTEAVGDVKLDALRGRAMLLAEGRRLVTNLATALSTSPRRDIFSATEPRPQGDAFGAFGDRLNA